MARKYIPNSELELWNYIDTHQDESLDSIAERFSMARKDLFNLIVFWASGNREAFNQR